jgi:hypothetical protein
MGCARSPRSVPTLALAADRRRVASGNVNAKTSGHEQHQSQPHAGHKDRDAVFHWYPAVADLRHATALWRRYGTSCPGRAAIQALQVDVLTFALV